MPEPRNLAYFATCPACGHDFGVPPSGRLPSLHLTVGPGAVGRMQWRLSLFDHSGEPGRHWQSTGYDPEQAQDVFWICGDGHLFFDHQIQRAGRTAARVDDFGSAAAVGAIAAGKSYLLLRTLNQHLALPPNEQDTRRGAAPTRMHAPSFEARPMLALQREYDSTVEDNVPLDPTSLQEMVPNKFLADSLGDDVVEQIKRIHTELLGASPALWGAVVRQPIVQRYSTAGKVVLTSVADLPGEFFRANTYDQEHRQKTLATYDSLLWVIDPIVESKFRAFLPADEVERLTKGSMRPDQETLANLDRARARRRQQQRHIADQLTGQGSYGNDRDTSRKLLVCLSKADLIEYTLRRGRTLNKLGGDEIICTGVADYLIDVSNRCAGRDGHALVVEEAVWGGLIRDLTQDRSVPQIRQSIALHIARALVAHYNDPERLWNLVHIGGKDRITVEAGESETELSRKLIVPSVEEHIAASLTTGEGGLLRQRDLIMSALTCGLVYALGMKDIVRQLFEQSWRETRFYLCSPFSDVPVPTPGRPDRFQREDGEEFPVAAESSAALTQLKLALMAGVQQ